MEGLDYITSIAEEAEKKEETYRRTESELRERIRRQEEEINAQQGRFHALLLMYRRLVSPNRDFIGMAGRGDGAGIGIRKAACPQRCGLRKGAH